MADGPSVSDATATASSASSDHTSCNHSSSEPVQSEPQSAIELQAPPTPSLQPSLSWKSIRSSITVSEKTSAQLGWAIAFFSVLLTIVTLSPAFKSQDYAQRSLEIAEWTALKDYIEECREELAAGVHSQACLKAMNATLPPPPYAKPGILGKMKRSLFKNQEYNGTTRSMYVESRNAPLPRVFQGFIFFGIFLTASVFLFLSFEGSRSRIRRHSYSRPKFDQDEELSSSPRDDDETKAQAWNHTIRFPPSNAVLRRRAVRTHPIYRHSTLGGAICAEDAEEIRIRFKNGEDPNEHWPYFIYRLAISPKSALTSKQLEIARSFLDFGADPNAVKGWNGQSALKIAIHFGNADVAKLLIANGAMVRYHPPECNLTALHGCVRLAVAGSPFSALEIMQMLFQHGANANQTDQIGETALHKLLIDVWCSRHDEAIVNNILPIALCLVHNGALMPEHIKEKYVQGNPLWDPVQEAVMNRTCSEMNPDVLWDKICVDNWRGLASQADAQNSLQNTFWPTKVTKASLRAYLVGLY